MTDQHAPKPATDFLDTLVEAIGAVAPDVVDEVRTLDADIDLFEEFGLDSMDRLTIMERLSAATGREISDEIAPELTTIAKLRAHLT